MTEVFMNLANTDIFLYLSKDMNMIGSQLSKCWESYCNLQVSTMSFSQSTEQVLLLYVLLFPANSSDDPVTFARFLPCHIRFLIKIKNSCLCFFRKIFFLLVNSFGLWLVEQPNLLARVKTMCSFLHGDWANDSMAQLTAFPNACKVL